MPAEPLNGIRYPLQSDGPLGGLQIGYSVTDMAPLLTGRYPTEAARDTAVNAWVAAGGVLKNGHSCWIDNIGCYTDRFSGTWFRRYPGGPRGLLCKPVKISNNTGGGTKFAAPAGTGGTGYFEMGRTPDLYVDANRSVELQANVDWINGGAVAGVGVRWERVQVAGGSNNGATTEEGFFIGGSTPDSIVPICHRFVDTSIIASGTYRWILAAKTTVASNTAGIGENAWAFMTATDLGPIPGI